MRHACFAHLLVALSVLPACVTGDGDPPDASADATSAPCHVDADCDNGLTCDGPERCRPDDPLADRRGCVPGTPPCPAAACDEDADTCATDPCAEPDADGDGASRLSCGGDDCDDADPARFPGNPEVCDDADLDEDCDPTTFGRRDLDGDGYFDAACCNGAGAERVCGTDCDDDATGVNPGTSEVCDGVDNDCDTLVDEGVELLAYVDEDGDGYGSDAIGPTTVCAIPTGSADRAGDCDDADPARHPAADDDCDGVDDDCDGETDETADDLCAGDAVCVPSADGSAPACRVLSCAGSAADCNGLAEDGCEETLCSSTAACGTCGATCITVCADGYCGAAFIDPLEGTVTRASDGAAVAGAAVEVRRSCAPGATTDDTGAFSTWLNGSHPSRVTVRASAEGYRPTLMDTAATGPVAIPLFTDADVAAWAAALSPSFAETPRHGLLVVDAPWTGSVPIEVRGVPHGAILELPVGAVLGSTATLRRYLVPEVSPGTAHVGVAVDPGAACFTDCTPAADVYVDADALTYVRFSSCDALCRPI